MHLVKKKIEHLKFLFSEILTSETSKDSPPEANKS